MEKIGSVLDYISAISNIASSEAEIAKREIERLSFEQNNYDLSDDMMQYYQVVADRRTNRLKEITRSSGDTPNGIYENDISKKHYKFFYRGHYSPFYQLIPSVFRGRDWNKEDYYYHEIMVRCPEQFQDSSHLDKLVRMQHYDCPTRLLDVTTNPLVALYFACKNYGCHKCDASEEGQVFVFPILPNEVAYSDSDTALMLACLAKFSTQDKQQLYLKANGSLMSDKFMQIPGGHRYKEDVVERFYHEITTEQSSFKREIRPIDLLQPLFVQPNKTNGRILKQDGAFILNGLSRDNQEALRKINTMSYETLTIINKEAVLLELEQLGIHEAALFPEVDRVANYLKKR